MERVDEHPVSAGPLAVRWLGYELEQPVRAGSRFGATLVAENAGSAPWRSRGAEGVQLAYHWLDERGNPIVWDGIRTPLEHPVEPGERLELRAALRAPMPPGRYRLAFDLVDEGRLWFAEVGNRELAIVTEVGPRTAARTLAVHVRAGDPALAAETLRALDDQEEPIAAGPEAEVVAHLAPGCLPAPDWSSRVLDAHAEGFAAVGGSLEPLGRLRARRRAAGALAPWAPGSGRVPAFQHPLLCPTILAGLEPSFDEDVEGLPALDPPADEPWLYDGRIRMKVRIS